ncbi:MAG: hypothetical protein ABSB66_07780 [Candidatus Acidiferrales bacterium]|jgi:hypothetical protein
MLDDSTPISAAVVRAALVIAVVAACSSTAGAQTKTATAWTVTVDTTSVTAANPKPVYTVSPDQGTTPPSCDFKASDLPTDKKGNLRVCAGDTVYFQAITNPADDPSKWKSDLVVVPEDQTLDKGGAPVDVLHAKERNKDGGEIDKKASEHTPHNYSVVVLDEYSNISVVDDPKFIIGGGTYTIKADIEAKCVNLKQQLGALAQSQNKLDLQEKAKAIEEKVEKACIEIKALTNSSESK